MDDPVSFNDKGSITDALVSAFSKANEERRRVDRQKLTPLVSYSIMMSSLICIIGLYVNIGVPVDALYFLRTLVLLPFMIYSSLYVLKMVGKALNA